MKLLMITRKVDWQDASPAGFTYTWVKKIGEQLEKLYVVTWQESNRGDLLQNIEIESLSGNKFKKIFVLWAKLIKILPKVDGVFCHQNPEYTILAAPWAKIFWKKIVSWHTHGTVNWKLHLVNLLTNKILTASKESCRLKNRKKIEVTGHGIDIDYFRPAQRPQDDIFKIVSIGRISPSKDYKTLIEALKNIKNVEVKIIGGPVLKKDEKYFQKLKQLSEDIEFLGPISHNQILPYYQESDLFINLSQTGSVDKAVLEAMACQTLVLTSNEAFTDIVGPDLMFEEKNPQTLAAKIKWLMDLSEEEKEKIGRRLREEVVKNHNLENLSKKIINQFD